MLRPIFLLLLCGALAAAQVRKLHTRDLTRLSQVQVADYLTRNDVVFIPVGAVETNGIYPSDRDYVSPLGWAMALAEETNALYMPGLIWSYPGTTVVAPATVYMSPQAGTTYLKGIAASLLRQGFRRQVWISAGQGPAALTVGTMVREFFDEKHVPILYIDMDHYLPRLKLPNDSYEQLLYGVHHITGRMDDLPLKGDYGPQHTDAIPENKGLAALTALGYSGSMYLGSWIPDVMAHGGGHEPVLPASEEEREQWGKRGEALLRSAAKQMRMPEALNALQQHDRFTQQVIIPKLGKYLPTPEDAR